MHAGLKIIYILIMLAQKRPNYLLPTILAENITFQKISDLS